MSRLPNVSARVVVAALMRGRWQISHSTGGHQHLRHPDRAELRLTIPMHSGDLKRPLLKKIIKQAGLTEEEFRALL